MWIKAFVLSTVIAAVCPLARAAEHVTLKNGFELDCVRREAIGDKVRLYLTGSGAVSDRDANYLEVPADSVARVENTADLPEPTSTAKVAEPVSTGSAPTKEEIHQ